MSAGDVPAREAARTCPWCAAAAAPEATTCASCGAALAQRESLGDVPIPGLTAVDPALEELDRRPLHLRGPSPSQGAAPALIVGAAAGGPLGAVLIGGVVAVAAAEYLGGKRPGTGTALDEVGKPSDVALRALEKAEADQRASGGESAAPPQADGQAGGEADAQADGQADGQADAAAADDGRSIWRDMPIDA